MKENFVLKSYDKRLKEYKRYKLLLKFKAIFSKKTKDNFDELLFFKKYGLGLAQEGIDFIVEGI